MSASAGKACEPSHATGGGVKERDAAALRGPTPIFRIFDETKAKEFYVGFLDFAVHWEHRFEDGLPLYMEVGRAGCVIHLSEHHGDCCPGGAIRIETDAIETLHERLLAKDYRHARPGLETTPWNTREVTVTDPFGNRLIFFEPMGERRPAG